ncbi:hypothetical protein D8B46_05610 [Candidatus Gracilibacteria bacterium]|nr:MAG: hypothetical protein D8B46_05610 [Candidatus Gracilibacteria bacterium]
MKNKFAFTFVELLIVISILIIITIVIVKVVSDSSDKTSNTRVQADLMSISNSLNLMYDSEKSLPLPDGNRTYFKSNGAYSHENFQSETESAFGAYGKVTEKILPKKYLSEIPLDPRTNQYYSYGLLKEGNAFDVAGVTKNGEEFKARVVGSYRGDKGLSGLIREYNGPRFVMDGEYFLPYNPEKIILTATDKNKNIFKEKDKLAYNNGEFFKNGEKIIAEITEVDGKRFYDLFFSDGNMGRLELTGINKVELEFGKNNGEFVFENNLKSKVSLFLNAGKLWLFASDLKESESKFDIGTQDLTAAVRGTIFIVDNNSGNSVVTLVKGTIGVNDLTVSDNLVGKEIPEKVKIDKSLDKGDFPVEKENIIPIPETNDEQKTIFSTKDFVQGQIIESENGENISQSDLAKTKDFEENKNKFYGFKNGEVYTLEIEQIQGRNILNTKNKLIDNNANTKVDPTNDLQNISQNENIDFELKNIQKENYEEKFVYKGSCFEVDNTKRNRIKNKCDVDYKNITEGFKEKRYYNFDNFDTKEQYYIILERIIGDSIDKCKEQDNFLELIKIPAGNKEKFIFEDEYNKQFKFYKNCNKVENIEIPVSSKNFIIDVRILGRSLRKLIREGGEVVGLNYSVVGNSNSFKINDRIKFENGKISPFEISCTGNSNSCEMQNYSNTAGKKGTERKTLNNSSEKGLGIEIPQKIFEENKRKFDFIDNATVYNLVLKKTTSSDNHFKTYEFHIINGLNPIFSDYVYSNYNDSGNDKEVKLEIGKDILLNAIKISQR